MCGFLEDIALPVHPYIAVPKWSIHEHLRTRFGVVRQQKFGIVERKEEGMGGTAINIAHGYRDAAASGTVKMGGGAEERQGVGTTLILAALPFCNVVEDV